MTPGVPVGVSNAIFVHRQPVLPSPTASGESVVLPLNFCSPSASLTQAQESPSGTSLKVPVTSVHLKRKSGKDGGEEPSAPTPSAALSAPSPPSPGDSRA